MCMYQHVCIHVRCDSCNGCGFFEVETLRKRLYISRESCDIISLIVWEFCKDATAVGKQMFTMVDHIGSVRSILMSCVLTHMASVS
jgi:hypothetical protein